MEMKNREQRRREKFGRAGKVSQHDPHDPWPESEANPALKSVAGDQVPDAGGTAQDATPEAGTKAPKTDEPSEEVEAVPKAKASTPKKRAKS